MPPWSGASARFGLGRGDRLKEPRHPGVVPGQRPSHQRRVVANRPIRDPNVPVMSFGEDEKGEVYLLTYTNTGQGIHWFVPSAPVQVK